jgi:hypothetical protein
MPDDEKLKRKAKPKRGVGRRRRIIVYMLSGMLLLMGLYFGLIFFVFYDR